MIGWHYTSAGYLSSITERGLVPYPLSEQKHPGIGEVVGVTDGIYVFTQVQIGLSHFGTAAAKGMEKKTSHIAVLECEWPDSDTAQTDRPLHHDGYFSGIVYHLAAPFVIVTRTIPPERIRMVDLVPTVAAVGWVLGETGVLKEWQDERIERGLPPGPVFDAAAPSKVGRNAPCQCGSGQKAKRCCAN